MVKHFTSLELISWADFSGRFAKMKTLGPFQVCLPLLHVIGHAVQFLACHSTNTQLQ